MVYDSYAMYLCEWYRAGDQSSRQPLTIFRNCHVVTVNVIKLQFLEYTPAFVICGSTNIIVKHAERIIQVHIPCPYGIGSNISESKRILVFV